MQNRQKGIIDLDLLMKINRSLQEGHLSSKRALLRKIRFGSDSQGNRLVEKTAKEKKK